MKPGFLPYARSILDHPLLNLCGWGMIWVETETDQRQPPFLCVRVAHIPRQSSSVLPIRSLEDSYLWSEILGHYFLPLLSKFFIWSNFILCLKQKENRITNSFATEVRIIMVPLTSWSGTTWPIPSFYRIGNCSTQREEDLDRELKVQQQQQQNTLPSIVIDLVNQSTMNWNLWNCESNRFLPQNWFF